MEPIVDSAISIALLFRSTQVPYAWLQKEQASSILASEREIIGSTAPNRPPEECKPMKVIFGGVIKNPESDEEKTLLVKTEMLVGT